MTTKTISRTPAHTSESVCSCAPADVCSAWVIEGIAIVAAARSVNVEMVRARSELKRWMPFRSPPTTNARPSTSTLFARIEPTSADWTTVTRPERSAKSEMKSSGMFPSADCTTPALPEPSRAPS